MASPEFGPNEDSVMTIQMMIVMIGTTKQTWVIVPNRRSCML